MPDRAPAMLRAAVAAFVVLLSPTPRDAGIAAPPIAGTTIHRADGPQRTASHAYQITQQARPDAGKLQPVVDQLYPDRAPGPQRASPTTYQITQPSPRDSGVPGGTWPESDTFSIDPAGTDLSAHTPDTGGTWVVDPSVNGDAVISSNQRLRQNSSAKSIWTINVNPPSPNYYVQAELYAYTLIPNEQATGVFARYQGSGNGYAAYYAIGPPNTWYIAKISGGSITPIGTNTSQTISILTPYTIQLSLLGSQLTLTVNGVTVAQATDTTYSTAGLAGVFFGGVGTVPTDATGVHIDNYQTGPVLQDPIFPPLAQLPRSTPSSIPALESWIWPGTPADQGILTQPIISAPLSLPRATPSSLPALESVIWPGTPNDSGTSSIGPEYPDRFSTISNLPAQQSWLWPATPHDLGPINQPLIQSPLSLPRATPSSIQAQSAWLWPGTPRDAGSLPIGPEYPDRFNTVSQLPAQRAWIWPDTPPDQGIIQAPPSSATMPDRALGLARFASYQIAQASRPDAGKLQPITVQILPTRADGPQRTANAAYLVTLASRPDAGRAQPIVFPVWPDRANGPQRAAWIPSVVPSPPDFGIIQTAPVAASMPSRADGPQSWSANLQVVHAAQPDAGTQQPIVGQLFPAIAPGSRRTAQTAYDILVPSRTDPGLPQPVIFPIYPSVAWASKPAGPQRWLAHGSWVVQSPHEPGTQPIVQAQLPDRWRRAEWTAATAYQIANQSPHEAGKRPIAPLMPDQFRTPLRAATAAYFVANHGPGDPGKRPIAPSMPDVARGAIRAATYLVAVPAPLASPILPTRSSFPIRADGSRRASLYPFSTPPPRDPGKRPVPQSLPDIARGPKPTVYGSFTVQKPRDPGRVAVRGYVTDRANGPRRAAAVAYQIINPALKDPGKRPIQGLLPDRAPGHQPRLGNYQIIVQANKDNGIVVINPVFADPRSATTLPIFEP